MTKKVKKKKQNKKKKKDFFCEKITFLAFFGTFWSKLFFFELVTKFFDQKSGVSFGHFLKKSAFLVKFRYQNAFSNSFSFLKMYTFIYITVIMRKLQGAIFFTISRLTLLLNENALAESADKFGNGLSYSSLQNKELKNICIVLYRIRN